MTVMTVVRRRPRMDHGTVGTGDDSRLGVDTMALGFYVHDFDPEHPDVTWNVVWDYDKTPVTSTRDFMAGNTEFDSCMRGDGEYPEQLLAGLWQRRPIQCPCCGLCTQCGEPISARVHHRKARLRHQSGAHRFVGLGQHRDNARPVAKYFGVYRPTWGVRIDLTVTDWDGWVHASVTFNPARLRDPGGWGLCPVEESESFATAVLAHLAERQILVRLCPHVGEVWGMPLGSGKLVCVDTECMSRQVLADDVKPGDPGHGVSLTRLDLAVDFAGVTSAVPYLDILETSRYFKKRYPTGARLSTGRRGVQMTFYGKQAEAAHRRQGKRPPPGTFRFEVKLTKDALGRQGLRSPVDMRPAHLWDVWSKNFVRAGLDRAVGGFPHRLRPRGAGGLTATSRQRLDEMMSALAAGSDGPFSDKTERKYRVMAARMGLIVGLPRHRQPSGSLRHLDPQSGREASPPAPMWLRTHGMANIRFLGPDGTRLALKRGRNGGRLECE